MSVLILRQYQSSSRWCWMLGPVVSCGGWCRLYLSIVGYFNAIWSLLEVGVTNTEKYLLTVFFGIGSFRYWWNTDKSWLVVRCDSLLGRRCFCILYRGFLTGWVTNTGIRCSAFGIGITTPKPVFFPVSVSITATVSICCANVPFNLNVSTCDTMRVNGLRAVV